jgi:hypothetical protein
MRKAVTVLACCVAFAACTPLLGLGDLKFEDGGGGSNGDAGGAGPKPGSPLWAARIGALDDDAVQAIAMNGSEILVAGCLGAKGAMGDDAGSGVMDPDGACTFPSAPFVARYSEAGKQTRLDALPVTGAASAQGIAAAPNGDVFVAGSFVGEMFDGALKGGAMRLPFVAELDAAAKPRWSTNLDVSNYGGALAVAADGASPVVSGFFNGSLTGLAAGGGDDPFWAKLDDKGLFSSGALIGQEMGGDLAYAAAVAVGPSGEVAIAGNYTGNFHDAPLLLNGDIDGFVVLYGPTRKLKWTVTVRGAGTQSVNIDAIGKKGDVFIGGFFVGGASIGKAMVTGVGGVDGFVARLGSDGKLAWLRGLTGQGEETVRGIAVDDEADAYVVGSASPGAMLGEKTILNHGGVDGFLAKLDPDGEPAWITSMGGAGDDRAYAVTLGADAIYIGGTFNATAEIAGKKLTSRGGVDGFIAAFAR